MPKLCQEPTEEAASMARSPLEQACWDGDLDAVKGIITDAKSAELSETDLETALCAALDGDHREIVSVLLDHNAPMSNRALRRVCNRGGAQLIKDFLDHGWNPNTQFVNGEPPLRLLIRDRESVKLMLARGADPNLIGQSKITPLGSALVCCEAPDIPELLMSHGATLDPGYIYKVLHPVAKASETMTSYLLKLGVDVNTPSEQWSTPLHFAVHQESPSKVKLLLEAGADSSAIAHGLNYTGVTPAQLAERIDATEIHDLIEEACVRASEA